MSRVLSSATLGKLGLVMYCWLTDYLWHLIYVVFVRNLTLQEHSCSLISLPEKKSIDISTTKITKVVIKERVISPVLGFTYLSSLSLLGKNRRGWQSRIWKITHGGRESKGLPFWGFRSYMRHWQFSTAANGKLHGEVELTHLRRLP